MPFCIKCGYKNKDGAKFCLKCGEPFDYSETEEVRKTSFAGEVKKCPNCGAVLDNAISAVCPACGFELRNVSATQTSQSLFEELQNAENEQQKVELIKFFPIPNSIEDICDLMILAVANFDMKRFTESYRDDMSDAWYSKLEQCYQKAKISFSASPVFMRVEEIYNDTQKQIAEIKARKKAIKIASIIAIIAGVLLAVAPYKAISYIGVVMLVTGIVALCVNSSKAKPGTAAYTKYNNASQNNASQNNVTYTNNNNSQNTGNSYQANTYTYGQQYVPRKTGFSSWSTGVKIAWIILNIYTMGIPALIYISTKKK